MEPIQPKVEQGETQPDKIQETPEENPQTKKEEPKKQTVLNEWGHEEEVEPDKVDPSLEYEPVKKK